MSNVPSSPVKPRPKISESLSLILKVLNHPHYELVFSTHCKASSNPTDRIRALYISAWHRGDYQSVDFHPKAWNDIVARFIQRPEACLLIEAADPDQVASELRAFEHNGMGLQQALAFMLNHHKQLH